MNYPTNNGEAFTVNAPQLENGYIRIANELFEAVCKVKLPNEAMRIFLAIMRLTYGWNRKEAVIRNYELVELTGVLQQNIKRAISVLTTTKMVNVIQPDNKSYPKYCINKNYEEWTSVIQPDNLLSNQITPLIQPDNSELSNQITDTPSEPLGDKGSSDPKDSKDIIKNIRGATSSQSISKPKIPERVNGNSLVHYFCNLYKYYNNKTFSPVWTKDAGRMATLHKKNSDEILDVIDYYLNANNNTKVFWTMQPRTIANMTVFVNEIKQQMEGVV